jgi:hypothetical protein
MRKGLVCLIAGLAVLLMPIPTLAQDHEGGGGGGEGCGDVLGDLIHILRDPDTGQPILAQRWIEMPNKTPGYGWGYCPIAVDSLGNELAFADLSCDVAEADLERVVEVDYFGRLSGGRTKERNSRMHFNEVISNIKDPETMSVGLDETGRLLLGYGCSALGATQCDEWSVIDSPMENLALYTRLMKYGHFQTDPAEVDMWAKGDPAAGTQYHPALTAADWAKFQPVVRHLLPGGGEAPSCEEPACFEPESLTPEDFVAAGAALGGAANKTGIITVDLVQYMNRILKITKDTEASMATADTQPALVRDCWSSTEYPVLAVGSDGEVILEDPDYDTTCTQYEANASSLLPNYDAFPDVQELFVDFSASSYDRAAWRNTFVDVIGPLPDDNNPTTPRPWVEVNGVSILEWLWARNGEPPVDAVENIAGFVSASSDTLRAIEFVHNYAIPEDLDWSFVPSGVDVKIKIK